MLNQTERDVVNQSVAALKRWAVCAQDMPDNQYLAERVAFAKLLREEAELLERVINNRFNTRKGQQL